MRKYTLKMKPRPKFRSYIMNFRQGRCFYIGRKYLSLLLLCTIIFVSGCMTTLNFETLSIGHYCGHVEKANYVINSLEEWTNLLETSHLNRIKLPKINFTTNTVIATFMGERKTGGYSVEIKKIKDSGKEIIVYIKERAPAKGAIKTMLLTQPYHIVKVKKIKKPVVFRSH